MASEDGVIYSTNYKNSGKTKPIKPAQGPDGYWQSMFQDDSGKYKSMKIHRIVAMAYLGPKPLGMEINHKNGNKSDNRPSNLEYCTRSQNCQHSFDMGLQQPKRGTLNGMAKLSEADVAHIRNQAKNANSRYYGRAELAEKYGVSQDTIKAIVTRRRNSWPHVQ